MNKPSKHGLIIEKFLQPDMAGGILLIVATVLAMILANSPLGHIYNLFIDLPVEVRIGQLEIAKPLLLWINDGLMALFFLLVGLELKREVMEGELSSARNVGLPIVGAVGGMAVPALVYVAFNYDNPSALNGWAIPAATDIAFALGILSLLGSRVPVSIKIFLTSLAIFDDIGAIIIIAIFYTSKISMISLIIAAVCILGLFLANLRGSSSRSIYLLIGAIMWIALLKSGVHATLAGVILAMFIPMEAVRKSGRRYSPLKNMEHDLHSGVAFVILPLFAFANAGLDLSSMTMESVLHGVPVGIALGLVVGKPLGIFGFCWVSIKMGWATLPKSADWKILFGTSVLCGIGFTMSLFIGSLAFEESGINSTFDERLGILVGSFVAGFIGWWILNKSLPAESAETSEPASTKESNATN